MNKQDTIKALKEAKDAQASIVEDERKRALEEMNRDGDKGVKPIVFPEYAMDKRLKVMREVNPPSDKLFIGLGWDEDDTTKRKHYRTYYPDELENNKELFPNPSPFDTFKLKKGQTRGMSSGGLFTFKKPKKATEECTGYFKGIIQIESVPAKKEYAITK